MCEPCAIAMGIGYRLEANPNSAPWKRALGGLLWLGGLGAALGIATGAMKLGRHKRSGGRVASPKRSFRKSRRK